MLLLNKVIKTLMSEMNLYSTITVSHVHWTITSHNFTLKQLRRLMFIGLLQVITLL